MHGPKNKKLRYQI